MDINNLQGTLPHSYRIDADRIRQRLQHEDKSSAVVRQQGDSVDISREGRRALEEKMSAVRGKEQAVSMGKLSPVSSGLYDIINDFTKTDSFDGYVNKMASAYQHLKDRIEDKYAAAGSEKEYYTAEDGSIQELTKEKELEMLDKDYETHSRFMAANMRIWSELQDFQAQTVYHSGGSAKEPPVVKKQSADVEEQAYRSFMDAISEKNSTSTSARHNLNSIWDFYAKMKQ